MASFSEQLSLDISQALRDVDRLESAITGTAQRFRTSLAQGIDQLRDVTIEVRADTSTIPREVARAVDVADSEVEVTADTTVARREVRRLGDEADRSTGGVSRLRTALAGISAAALVAGIRGLADAASALEEQTSGAEVVFGDLAGQVQSFAASAPQIGLAADAALRSANAFGLLAQSAGLANEATVDFATTIVQRGADIASLRDLDLTETLNALRSGLVGETEPLRNLGIFLNEATVQARALELGLGDANGVISDAEKIQARYSLILEQSAIAAGNFALTADGLANTQRRLAAEARNAAIVVGQSFQPELQELLAAGEDLLPILVDLGTEALPALVSIVTSLTPALGGTLSVVAALAPVLQIVADVVEAIPPELILLTGGAIAGARALSGLGSVLSTAATSMKAFTGATAAANATGAAGGLPLLISRVATLNPLILAGGAAIGVFAVATASAARRKQEFRQAVDEATSALRTEEGVLETTGRVLADYVEETSRFADRNQIDDLRRVGLTFAEVGTLSEQGGQGLREFFLQAQRSGEIEPVILATGRLADVSRLSDEQLRRLAEGQRVFVDGQEIVVRGNQDLIESFAGEQAVLAETARAELDRLAGLDASTAALVRNTEAANTNADGTVSFRAVLAEVNDALEVQARTAERVLASFGPLANQYVGLAEAVGRVAATAPDVATAIRDVRLRSDESERSFLNLAIAIDAASLSEEQLADVAAVTGTDVERLQGFVEGLTGALDEFVSTAVGRLPTVGSVFIDTLGRARDAAGDLGASVREAADDQITALSRANEDQIAGIRASADAQIAAIREVARASEAEVDQGQIEAIQASTQAQIEALQRAGQDRAEVIREAAAFEAAALEESARITADSLAFGFLTAAADLQDFRADLRRITEGGFADLAGLIAQQGPEVGGALADELAAALEGGNAELLEGLSNARAVFEAESNETVSFVRDVLGPELILTTGLLGGAITESFGENLDFGERIRISAELARSGLTQEGQAIAAIAAVEGERAARGYADALDLEQATIEEGVRAGNAIRNSGLEDAGSEAAESMVRGFEAGWRIRSISDIVGEELETAVRRGKTTLQIASPSRVFMEMGALSGEGFALGLEGSAGRVKGSTDRLLALSRVNTANLVPVGSPSAGAAQGAQAIDQSRSATAQVSIDARGHSPSAIFDEFSARTAFALGRLLPPT